jgi:hypothetical protein
MLPRPVVKHHIRPAISLLSTPDDLAPPATPSKRKKPKRKDQQAELPHTPPQTPEPHKSEPDMPDTKEYESP